ncbi:MAG: hypothetical protein FJ241_03240, partial [Nitrospira sp.]|nr:hypothetical protein [Nitrospira sp.]
MCVKNAINSNGEKLYLATFEFVSGEYEQSFQRFIYTKNAKDVDRKINNYLKDYYGKGNTSEIDGDDYYYFYGEIAVRYCGWQEITDFQQLVNKL